MGEVTKIMGEKSLAQEKRELLDILYWDYKNYMETRLEDLQQITNINRTTIGRYYKNKFKEEYLAIVNLKRRIKPPLSEDQKNKISIRLKGKKKPPRSEEHKRNLSLAFKGRTFSDRFGKNAEIVKEKISHSNKGKKRAPRSDIWRINLSNSLKGREV